MNWKGLGEFSGFHRELDEKYVLLCYNAATFGDNQSVPSSRVCPLKMGPIDCPETPARNYHYSLRNFPEGRRKGLVKMFSGWVVATRHLPLTPAHARLSLSWRGSCPGLWTSTYLLEWLFMQQVLCAWLKSFPSDVNEIYALWEFYPA
jgi:hypothetical protein